MFIELTGDCISKAVFSEIALIALMVSSNATYLSIAGPINANLTNNGSVFLGNVGPGQSFYVLASAATTNASGSYVNIGWDTLKAEKLPQGWSSQASPLYENPMEMKITVAPNALDGRYAIELRAVNVGNYSKLGNLTVTAYVNVTTDVFSLAVSPKNISAGIGQPINLYVHINNTGISDDPFLIGAYGLPAWNETYQVISLHGTNTTFVYPVYASEPGLYEFNLTVTSISSPLITNSYRINLLSQASLLNDYNAVGQGVVLSPMPYGPVYAFISLLNYIYSTFAK